MDAHILSVVAEILSCESQVDPAETFAGILTDVFDNDSYTENVIDGKDTPLFEDNLSKVSLSVSQIAEVALTSDLIETGSDLDQVQESLTRVQELLTLLGSTVEGA